MQNKTKKNKQANQEQKKTSIKITVPTVSIKTFRQILGNSKIWYKAADIHLILHD